MKNSSALYISVICLVSSLALSSCGQKATSQRNSNKQISPLSCVVVLPVQTPYDEGLQGAGTAGDLKKGAAFLDQIIPKELNESKVSRVVETAQIRSSIGEISGGKMEAVRDIGKRSGCSNALVTKLNTFRQRQGGELSVDAPAAAAFEMRIVDTENGKSLWMSSFSETQVSLFENLFSFTKASSRGFKWITVENLISQGVKEKIQECPYFY